MTFSHRRIDHLVLAVHDLDRAAAVYEGLGFQVGARNRHPWGTENRLIQFRSSFLELITIGDGARIPPHAPGRFSFGAFVRDRLERREGLAMVVLDSTDAPADAAAFARTGIGRFEPFHFERKGRRPDGRETVVAFSLAFALDPRLPDTAFFVCQQHHPENFWNPAFQQHPNGALDVGSVTLEVPDPSEHADFLAGFTGSVGRPGGERGLVFPLRGGGRLIVASGAGASGGTSYRVATADPADVAERLRRRNMPLRTDGDAVTVGPAEAFGVAIQFGTAGTR
ncbi:VOC family protein [Azospirillum argentinense]|uniref:VOC family protein n=1 Tax=Azospirillum brasilense TaxID=192 RepID=A0A4D8Q707_AZOBR|nr:VOC family protein [Azospirillum argentinense]QCO05854.1 VOC family protein [Azospirillum argentinense]